MSPRPAPVDRWHGWPSPVTPPCSTTSSTRTASSARPRCTPRRRASSLTTAYLAAALVVLGPTLSYQDEWWDEESAVLEFTAELDG